MAVEMYKISVHTVYGEKLSIDMNVRYNLTIHELKHLLKDQFPSHPSILQQRIIYAGKLCNDTETIEYIIKRLKSTYDANHSHVFHLITPSNMNTNTNTVATHTRGGNMNKEKEKKELRETQSDSQVTRMGRGVTETNATTNNVNEITAASIRERMRRNNGGQTRSLPIIFDHEENEDDNDNDNLPIFTRNTFIENLRNSYDAAGLRDLEFQNDFASFREKLKEYARNDNANSAKADAKDKENEESIYKYVLERMEQNEKKPNDGNDITSSSSLFNERAYFTTESIRERLNAIDKNEKECHDSNDATSSSSLENKIPLDERNYATIESIRERLNAIDRNFSELSESYNLNADDQQLPNYDDSIEYTDATDVDSLYPGAMMNNIFTGNSDSSVRDNHALASSSTKPDEHIPNSENQLHIDDLITRNAGKKTFSSEMNNSTSSDALPVFDEKERSDSQSPTTDISQYPSSAKRKRIDTIGSNGIEETKISECLGDTKAHFETANPFSRINSENSQEIKFTKSQFSNLFYEVSDPKGNSHVFFLESSQLVMRLPRYIRSLLWKHDEIQNVISEKLGHDPKDPYWLSKMIKLQQAYTLIQYLQLYSFHCRHHWGLNKHLTIDEERSPFSTRTIWRISKNVVSGPGLYNEASSVRRDGRSEENDQSTQPNTANTSNMSFLRRLAMFRRRLSEMNRASWEQAGRQVIEIWNLCDMWLLMKILAVVMLFGNDSNPQRFRYFAIGGLILWLFMTGILRVLHRILRAEIRQANEDFRELEAILLGRPIPQRRNLRNDQSDTSARLEATRNAVTTIRDRMNSALSYLSSQSTFLTDFVCILAGVLFSLYPAWDPESLPDLPIPDTAAEENIDSNHEANLNEAVATPNVENENQNAEQ